MKYLRSARRGEKGQAAVEFALTVVFLMLLIVGFVELVMMLHTYNVIADAAKEGVRYAIVHGAGNTGRERAHLSLCGDRWRGRHRRSQDICSVRVT